MRPPQIQETAFEKQRGISAVEVKPGFAQVHVSQLNQPIVEQRLAVLEAVAAAGISVDFLKLTPSGLSFLISEGNSESISEALEPLGVHYSVRKDRSIVMVHAVNMRDEEGLIAKIIQAAITSGSRMDHVSDMHDRMLMVVPSSAAEAMAAHFRSNLMEVGRG